MSTLSLYSLINNYLQHSWNVTSITSAVLMVRNTLLPASTIVTNRSTTRTTMKHKKKQKTVLYPTYIKELSEATDFFSTTPIADSNPSNMNNNNITHQRQDHHVGLLSNVTPRYRAPRKPIVLCHGLYGFDRIGPNILPSLQVHYWNGIEKALGDLGAKVIVTRVPKTETISNRAYALHSILSTFMENQDINFISHSMGGLDCRYLLSHIKHRSYRVSSLSTICTPHRGSPVMDWFRDNMGLGKQLKKHKDKSSHLSDTPMTNTTSCMLGDISKGHLRRSGNDDSSSQQQQQQQQMMYLFSQWFDTPAYSNLTTEYCTRHFNPSTPDDPSVSYYSYTAKSTPYWSSLLGFPGHLIQNSEGDNDGIVSVNSGQWGQHVKTINDADHWDFTGKSMVPYRWKATTNSDFDRTEFYVELANYLYEQGH